jgi:hypothetical protein
MSLMLIPLWVACLLNAFALSIVPFTSASLYWPPLSWLATRFDVAIRPVSGLTNARKTPLLLPLAMSYASSTRGR